MIKIIFFDVFGTLVDWRKSLMGQIKEDNILNGDDLFVEKFVINWRLEYQPILDKVNNKQIPWMTLDKLHLLSLNNALKKMKIDYVSESNKKKMIFYWHRLNPWDDTKEAIISLNKKFLTSSLSNGNIYLQKNLIKYAGLELNFLVSAESVKLYKPNINVYLSAAESIGFHPNNCALVASHRNDLKAASKAGFFTTFIKRGTEYGKFSYKFPKTNFIPNLSVGKLTEIKKNLIT